MNKLILILFVLSSFLTTTSAQTPFAEWNNFYYYNSNGVPTYSGQDADTMYCAIVCRNGKFQAMTSKSAGSLTAQALPAATFDAGDSLTWRVIKGAPYGTKPRVRMVNLKTGEYLKQGTINGVLTAYVAPYTDSVADGELNFFMQYQSVVGYFLVGKGNTQFFNDVSGLINLKNNSTSAQGWYMHARKGPLPKSQIVTPNMALTTEESSFYAGGQVTLKAKITKGASDLKGSTLLYLGENLVDTIELDQNGEGSTLYSNLVYGSNIFTLVYTGDENYGAEFTRDTLQVAASPLAVGTKLNLTFPSSSELYGDATLNINAQTTGNDLVSTGDVLVYVNDNLKNRATLDMFGSASVNFPNLLVGTSNIKAIYVGNKMDFLDSDTARVSIEVSPSSSNVVPYPVYFDLSSQFEINDWVRKNPKITSLVTSMNKYTHKFRTDSLPGITVTDTINNTFKVANVGAGTAYAKTADAYNHADYVTVPLGSSRPTSVKIKTPWLNAGAYNIYMSHRKSGDAKMNINAVTLDDKDLYWPNEEMYGRWFRSNLPNNNTRTWNAKAADAPSLMYLGSANTSVSGVHTLMISVVSENGTDIMMDMLQFVPIDQDSLSINLKATQSMSKKYYPMFSWTGFTYLAGYDAASVAATFADHSNLALPYQVTDVTNWGTSYPYTVSGFDVDTIMSGSDPVYANYVTVYKADDKWTRVAEGYAANGQFAGELPQGKYYYETINFTDLGDGAYDYRTLVKTGYFELPFTGTENVNNSTIKVFSADRKLFVKGIETGAKVLVADLTGRLIVNSISNSDNYSVNLEPGVYVVKVISGETLNSKVLVK